jgi:hypothetical protein
VQRSFAADAGVQGMDLAAVRAKPALKIELAAVLADGDARHKATAAVGICTNVRGGGIDTSAGQAGIESLQWPGKQVHPVFQDARSLANQIKVVQELFRLGEAQLRIAFLQQYNHLLDGHGLLAQEGVQGAQDLKPVGRGAICGRIDRAVDKGRDGLIEPFNGNPTVDACGLWQGITRRRKLLRQGQKR